MRTTKPRSGNIKATRSTATEAPEPDTGLPLLPAAARRGIQSVNIGFRVLAALAAEPEAATLGTVAKRSNLSASQTHRYLASLVTSGMARQDPSSGRYELGSQAIQIGLAALARTDVFAQTDPAIAAFTRETGRTTLVAACGPLGPTIVRWHAGRTPVTTSLSIGSTLPLLGSATGHVFLSFMGTEEMAGAVEREIKISRHGGDADAIRRKVRAEMSASVDEMLIPGLRAVAVPVLDIQERAALVVTVMATAAFDRRDDKAVVEKLKNTCANLTEKIGGRWPAHQTTSRL